MKNLARLIRRWRIDASAAQRKSSETYEKLGCGDLPQEDAIIYSVYEDDQKAATLRDCAAELEAILKNIRGKK